MKGKITHSRGGGGFISAYKVNNLVEDTVGERSRCGEEKDREYFFFKISLHHSVSHSIFVNDLNLI